MPVSARYRPDPRIVELGDGFYDVVAPAWFPRHVLRYRNQRWAERVGLDALDATEWGAVRCIAWLNLFIARSSWRVLAHQLKCLRSNITGCSNRRVDMLNVRLIFGRDVMEIVDHTIAAFSSS